MAKLIYESLEILDNTTPTPVSQGIISNIVVDSIEPSLEAETVAVEDNREINESFTGRIVCRTKNTTFDGGGNILDSAYVSTDGTLPTEGKLRLNGKAGSHDLTTGLSYIMGHYAFDNGRLEIVLSAQSSDVDSANAMGVATAS